MKFAALYHHGDGSFTKFLALDKCLPNRRYLQVGKGGVGARDERRDEVLMGEDEVLVGGG